MALVFWPEHGNGCVTMGRYGYAIQGSGSGGGGDGRGVGGRARRVRHPRVRRAGAGRAAPCRPAPRQNARRSPRRATPSTGSCAACGSPPSAASTGPRTPATPPPSRRSSSTAARHRRGDEHERGVRADPPQLRRVLRLPVRAVVAVDHRHAGQGPRLRRPGVHAQGGPRPQPGVPRLVQPLPRVPPGRREEAVAQEPRAAAPRLGPQVRDGTVVRPGPAAGPGPGHQGRHGRGEQVRHRRRPLRRLLLPLPRGRRLPDDATYKAHGGGMDRGDWRRENVDTSWSRCRRRSTPPSPGCGSASAPSACGATRATTPPGPPPAPCRATTTSTPTPANGSRRGGSTTSPPAVLADRRPPRRLRQARRLVGRPGQGHRRAAHHRAGRLPGRRRRRLEGPRRAVPAPHPERQVPAGPRRRVLQRLRHR